MTELPDRLSCDECRTQGKHIMHSSFDCLLDTKQWSWSIMNHDQKTQKFTWPKSFPTLPKAKEFVQSLLDDAAKGDNDVD